VNLALSNRRKENERDRGIHVVRFDIIDVTHPAGAAEPEKLGQKMLDEGDGGREDRRSGMVRADAGSDPGESEGFPQIDRVIRDWFDPVRR
jgi:hypothetical protein